MDKEAVEKIAKSMFQLVFLVDDKEIEQRWEHLQLSVKRQWSDKAENLIEVFEEFGYRKPTEPPLLSDEEIDEVARAESRLTWLQYGRDIAQAQFQLCKKHYEG